tara:strand:+ start:304 stop:570 length:267 start_codon:yes stop_codon:yes gene_type:complete
MDKNAFLRIVKDIYINSKDYWDLDVPEQIDFNFKIAGKDSLLSSIEVVTFLAELETELLKLNINISYLDKILELDSEEISINTLYELI